MTIVVFEQSFLILHVDISYFYQIYLQVKYMRLMYWAQKYHLQSEKSFYTLKHKGSGKRDKRGTGEGIHTYMHTCYCPMNTVRPVTKNANLTNRDNPRIWTATKNRKVGFLGRDRVERPDDSPCPCDISACW